MKARERRRDQLLNAAFEIVKNHGYDSIRRDNICLVAGVSSGMIGLHFKTMDKFKEALVHKAMVKVRDGEEKSEHVKVILRHLMELEILPLSIVESVRAYVRN